MLYLHSCERVVVVSLEHHDLLGHHMGNVDVPETQQDDVTVHTVTPYGKRRCA